MNAIPNKVPPPARGLDKEEPEQAYEDDIPKDDDPAVEDDGEIGRE